MARTSRRSARVAFAAAAAVALVAYWLSAPLVSNSFALAILESVILVTASAAVVPALTSAWRDEPTPEWAILLLLFAGGLALLAALIIGDYGGLPRGLAVFLAGAICVGGRDQNAGATPKPRRART